MSRKQAIRNVQAALADRISAEDVIKDAQKTAIEHEGKEFASAVKDVLLKAGEACGASERPGSFVCVKRPNHDGLHRDVMGRQW